MAGGGRIQGITVEIGGDTGPLSKALQGVNKEIQGTQSQLKDVERLLKMDPGNTELLQQKQRLLGDAIGETKTKLEALKTAEQQVQAQFQNGEISQKQYDGLKREIADTEIKLKGLEKSYNELGNAASRALQSASESIKGFGEKTSALGQKFLPVTAGITGLGVASIAAFNEVDAGYDTIITKTGATGEALEELQGSMDKVFSELPIDAEAAGVAIGEVNTRFGSTGEVLEDLSKQFIEFAEINGVDLNNSIGQTDKIMEQFGVTSDQTANVLGLLTAKGQETGLGVDILSSSVQKNGAVLKEMGLGLEQSIVFLSEMERNGVNADAAMAGLKKSVANYTKEGKSAEESLKLTIDSIKNATTETEAMSIASEVFGNKGAPEMSRAIREGRLSVDDLSVSLKEYGNVVEDTFNATLDPPDQAKVALNNLKLAGADLGNSLLTTLQPTLALIVEKVKEFTQWFKGLSDGQKELIIKIGALVAAIGPVLIVIGKLSAGFGSVVGIVGKVVGLFSGGGGLVAALGTITGPVGIVVAAVGALVAIFATLFATNEDFRNKVGEIWDQIQQIFSSVLEQIKGIIQGFIDVANAIWENFGTKIMAVVSAAFDFIKTYIDSAMKVVKDVIDVVMGLINGDWERVWSGLKNLVSDVLNGIMNIISSWQQLVQKAFELLSSVLGNVWTAIKGVALQAWEGLKTSVLGIVENIKTGVINGFNNLKSGVTTTVGNVATAIKNGLGKAVDYVKGLPSQFLGWGKDMIQGLINGIKSKIGAVGDAVRGVANKVKNFLHFSRPDEGPLRDYETWMPDFMTGLASGIRKNMRLVTGAMDALTGKMNLNVQPALAGAGAAGSVVEGDTNLYLTIEHMDNSSGQSGKDIAQQIDKELGNLAKRRGKPWQ